MTTTYFDGTFRTGRILVRGKSNPLVGVKILDYTWVKVDGVETKYWFLQSGEVNGNLFVLRKGEVWTATTQGLTDLKHSHEWSPDIFSSGDFLTDGEQVYYVETCDKIWALPPEKGKGAAYGSPSYWEGEGKALSLLETAGGAPFSEVAKKS